MIDLVFWNLSVLTTSHLCIEDSFIFFFLNSASSFLNRKRNPFLKSKFWIWRICFCFDFNFTLPRQSKPARIWYTELPVWIEMKEDFWLKGGFISFLGIIYYFWTWNSLRIFLRHIRVLKIKTLQFASVKKQISRNVFHVNVNWRKLIWLNND